MTAPVVPAVPLFARGIVQIGRSAAGGPQGREAPVILAGVNVDLPQGIAALIGPNGSGKTTLLRTLAGLLPVVEGHVEVEGTALQDSPSQIRRQVGYLAQFPGVYQNLTVGEHFERQAYWLSHGDLLDTETALEKFELGPLKDVKGQALTLHQRRWLGLALIWARRARVLLLDEPTASLDMEDRVKFWNLVMDLRRDAAGPAAVLVTTHWLDEVTQYCPYVITLVGGRAVFQGPTVNLAERARGRSIWVEPGRSVPGAVETGIDSSRGLRMAVALGALPDGDLALRAPRLVDGYLVVESQWTEGRWADVSQTGDNRQWG